MTEASSVVLPALRVARVDGDLRRRLPAGRFPGGDDPRVDLRRGSAGHRAHRAAARTCRPGPASRCAWRTAAVVLVLMAGLGYLLYERGFGRAHAGQAHNSIAVLPFTNLSGDPARDYFSDGMSRGTAEPARARARACRSRRAPRRSPTRAATSTSARWAGSSGVETVLEGSVRQSGEQVRITAQLIDAETGFHLWSETYDRRLEDIFRVQDEIAAAIVSKLRIELAPQEQQLAVRDKAPTQNVEAYEMYLQGRASGSGAARTTSSAPSTCTSARSASTRASPAPTRRSPRLTSCCPATRARRATRRSSCRWPRPRRGRRCRSTRTSARRTRCWRRSTPSGATCSTRSRASSSRFRSSRTSRRRTTGTRCC